jgi:hypothetical protein
MAYQTIGPYRRGVWLVSKGGSASIVDRAHLPTGSGYKYYWLGGSVDQAANRIGDALPKLLGNDFANNATMNATGGFQPLISHAFKSGYAGLDTGSGWQIPDLATTIGFGALVGGVASEVQAATDVVDPFNPEQTARTAPRASDTTKPDTSQAKTDESAKAAAAAAAKAAGLAGLLGATGAEAFAIRILEGLVGVALIFLGLQALTGQGSGSPVQAIKGAATTAAKVAK